MKLKIPPPRNTLEVLSRRWQLSDAQTLVQSKRATVYKVASPAGPAALKLYTEIGYANERAAVAFSNNLPDGIGARILHSDFLRAAVLIEWLSGPPLAETFEAGDYTSAMRQACTLVAQISAVRFRWAFAYRRLTPLLRQRLKTRDVTDPEARQWLGDAVKLLDTQFGAPIPESVIHGDLHYGNIILTPDGPRAIDPKGIRAHPLFECRNLFVAPKAETTITAFTDRINAQIDVATAWLPYDRPTLLRFIRFQMINSTVKPGISADVVDALRDRLAVLTRLEETP